MQSGSILFLGRDDSPVLAYLRSTTDDVVAIGASEPITHELLDQLEPPFAVSHGYRLIVRHDILERFRDRIINLHISLLPFNRGASPTLWSVLEDTPAGVTIHHMDAGVDTGDIIAQARVVHSDDDTFATAYDALQAAMTRLFREHWPAIRSGTCDRRPQPSGGTTHRLRDQDAVMHLLTDGWHTPIGPLRGRLRIPALLGHCDDPVPSPRAPSDARSRPSA